MTARGSQRPRTPLYVLSALAFTLAACKQSTPDPKLGPHTDEEPVTVPYPPPPARVEIIPSPPAELKKPVWIDGEWQWRSRRWVWQAGKWEVPVAGGYYAPAATVRLADGTLVFYKGTWKVPGKTP